MNTDPFAGVFHEGNEEIRRAAEREGTVWARVPARGVLAVVVQKPKALHFRAHFNGPVGKLCILPPHCQDCAAGKGWKDRFVWTVYVVEEKRSMLLDLPGHTSQDIESGLMDMQGYDGVCFALSKAEGLKNGRLSARVVKGLYPLEMLPKPLDAMAVVKQQYLEQIENDRTRAADLAEMRGETLRSVAGR